MVRRFSVAFAATIILALLCDVARAGKPNKPGGGTTSYALVTLPDASGSSAQTSYANEIHEVRSDGNLVVVEVAGISAGRAHYWALDLSGVVVVTAELPLTIGADPEATVTDAKDINDGGVLVGSGDGVPLAWPSFLDTPFELPLPTGFSGTGTAVNINNHGLVVGWLDGADGESIVAWGLTEDLTPVGPVLLGGSNDGVLAWAPDVNDAGTVVGTIQSQAYRWQVSWDGTNLSASVGEALSAGGFTLQTATGINEFGDICGRYRPDGTQTYLLTASGELIDMPHLVDSGRHATNNIQATGLNDAVDVNSIQVVGECDVYRKKGTPIIDRLGVEVLWKGGQTTDLEKATSQSNSDVFLQWIGKVSDAGWLAGFASPGTDPFDSRAVVLVPNQ